MYILIHFIQLLIHTRSNMAYAFAPLNIYCYLPEPLCTFPVISASSCLPPISLDVACSRSRSISLAFYLFLGRRPCPFNARARVHHVHRASAIYVRSGMCDFAQTKCFALFSLCAGLTSKRSISIFP